MQATSHQTRMSKADLERTARWALGKRGRMTGWEIVIHDGGVSLVVHYVDKQTKQPTSTNCAI